MGGTRVYITNGMAREATQELGGWKTPSVIGSAHDRANSKEAALEMRGAIGRTRANSELAAESGGRSGGVLGGRVRPGFGS